MCELNPCAAGQQCSYSDFSVSCQECGAVIPFSHSENGLVCTMCKPGLGPTEDAAGCHPGLVANAGRSQCSDCGVHRTAVSSKRGIETAKTCGCDDKYYNASQQIRVCFHGSYDASEYHYAAAQHRAAVDSTGQECDVCPMDVTGESCLTWVGGQTLVSPGFMIPRISTTESVRSDSVLLFRWHIEMDLAVARCPGEAVLGADRLQVCCWVHWHHV